MRNIETDARMQVGRLVLKRGSEFLVTCADCLEEMLVYARDGDYERAVDRLRYLRWRDQNGIWRCPDCSSRWKGEMQREATA